MPRTEPSSIKAMKICCLFLILVLIPVEVAGSGQQTSEDESTAAEKLEIRRFVHSFSRRLRLTRNLSPFLNSPVAKRVLDETLADTDFVKREVALKVGPDRLRRFYLALTNEAYLSHLYCYSKLSLKDGSIRDLPHAKQYPPHVFRVLKSNPTIAAQWSKSDSSASEISSVEQLRSLTVTWERAAEMMRRYFKQHPPERSGTYRNNLSHFAPYVNVITVSTCKTGKDCCGLPVTREFSQSPFQYCA